MHFSRICPTLLLTAVPVVAWLICSLPPAAAFQSGEQAPAANPLKTAPQFSGVWPHLTLWNSGNECGTGAVVPWADRLWAITYSPHSPNGSDDQLYSISNQLEISAFEGSVGGTPANRLIHRETSQLVIGPYVIDSDGNVRVIPPASMPGRLTGTARHLFEPETKVYVATMEEGIYEVDLETLDVTELFADNQQQVPGGKPGDRPDGQTDSRRLASLPGYHGKGLYSGQGRLIYANNGEPSSDAMKQPGIPSGCLAEWDGRSDQWTVVRRNQFTDIRGPGGIYGNDNPGTDPVWAIGWDHRSLILMLLDRGQWYTYRLPIASHTYDGAHGWNTEWPRFQEIGEDDLVLNMHGMFWRFPRTFSRDNSAGLAPRSTCLKVIGDYCRWGEQLVFGCDDTARSEFLNRRKAKGTIAGPGQSHSSLWFAPPAILDQLGSPIGRGAVWAVDNVRKDQPSDPFLFSGFSRRAVHLVNENSHPVTFTMEVDRRGTNQWEPLREFSVAANASVWHAFDPQEAGVWLRVQADRDCVATAQFHFSSNAVDRPADAAGIFGGLATTDTTSMSGGLVRVRGDGLKTLAFAAATGGENPTSEQVLYELDARMELNRVDDPAALEWTLQNTAIPADVVTIEQASVLYVDDDGRRWRLPKGDAAFDAPGLLGLERLDREVATERDLFNCHGTFYELPADNAGGFAKIRPICTHNRRIRDYCSYRGLLVMSGVDSGAADSQHIVRSTDGRVALWVGVIDDLWKFGKPVGVGGPWMNTRVVAGEYSDPYLMTGYDRKRLRLSHHSESPVTIRAEVDIAGEGKWVACGSFEVPAGEVVEHDFPPEFAAYWIRFAVNANTIATVQLEYQ